LANVIQTPTLGREVSVVSIYTVALFEVIYIAVRSHNSPGTKTRNDTTKMNLAVIGSVGLD